MTFKLQNKYIVGLVGWVGSLGEATAKQTRMRSRFITLLIARLNETADLHKKILEKYAKKDENGGFVTKEVNGVKNHEIPTESMVAFQKEDQELLDENFILDITEANREMFETMKDFVLNTKYHFGPKEEDSDQVKQEKYAQANDYDKWCTAFEEAQ